MTVETVPPGSNPLPASAGQDLLHLLGQRYSTSPKYLAAPGPTIEEWTRAARLAERAPDHGALRPFRFVIVGDDQRPALSELFAQGALERGQPPDDVDRARARAFNGPGLAALVGRICPDVPDVPVHEQWMCVGAGLMNFLNALHGMGFAAKSLSGLSVSDEAIKAAFCGADESLACWIVAGRPRQPAHPRQPEPVAPLLETWRPTQA
ncbi:nitroreductase family protein [Rubrivivax albus]|uniref:Putative NAD(P)H nitroreductase n=1 Tax=Rubrivivax albus TaxID=2499835 RepID=A0A3S2TLS8_9BURK|nr:nitroreductase family protein [Rubrivivax albus]RVT50526.1 nitroreductase [Rubrivivax albus]